MTDPTRPAPLTLPSRVTASLHLGPAVVVDANLDATEEMACVYVNPEPCAPSVLSLYSLHPEAMRALAAALTEAADELEAAQRREVA